jgi:hypothetical protein
MKTIDDILLRTEAYEIGCQEGLVKLARVRKLPNGKYRVLSEKGKNLGTSDSKAGAEKRLKQVEFFKHRDQSHADDEKEVIDLMDADEFAYSAIMRKMRQKASKEQVRLFLKLYKECFDKAVKKKLQKPEKVALQNSLIKFNKVHPIKVKKKLVKQAAVSELGDPVLVGKYLADIVKFTLNRIDPAKRQAAVDNLRSKFYSFNADEIASKTMPATSAIGQSITFVKHVLFNHDAQYVREVLNNLVRNL